MSSTIQIRTPGLGSRRKKKGTTDCIPYDAKSNRISKTVTNAGLFSQRKTENLESTSTTTTAGRTSASSTASWSATATATTTVCLLAGLVLGLGCVIDKEGIEGKAVGENVIANCGTADVDGVKRNSVAALGGHLDSAERSVHLRGDGHDSAVKNCA